jgi:3-oxoacyl-(acyl-carrier-protein) synthase
MRAVITGMATINPLGDDLDTYYANLLAGKSGIKRWASLDISRVDCKIGGDLGDYDCAAALEALRASLDPDLHKQLRKLFRTMTLPNKTATLCALKAWSGAGLFTQGARPEDDRISVMVGGHNFNSRYVFEQNLQFLKEPAYVDPLYGIEALDPNIPGTICEVLRARGPAYNIGAACASGNIALRDGFRDIITGECDVSVIAGGFWDMNEPDINAMGILTALVLEPYFQDHPEEASRPFDKRRCGFVPSHGAAALILEEYEHAKRRGAPIWAEVLAVAANSNANHLPAPGGEAMGALMKRVIERAGIAPDEVDYVNCHATGTPAGDMKELDAVKFALGKRAYSVKLNAPKSMLGHTCWSAPLVEMIGGILQMKNKKLHATTNIDELADGVDLDVCAGGNQATAARTMLKNSFGFGGLNCCSLIRMIGE